MRSHIRNAHTHAHTNTRARDNRTYEPNVHARTCMDVLSCRCSSLDRVLRSRVSTKPVNQVQF